MMKYVSYNIENYVEKLYIIKIVEEIYMRRRIANDKTCTACNACIGICPVGCISYEYELDMAYSFASCDTEKCIKCGLCYKTCPQLVSFNGKISERCFVAWSTDSNIRESSASGGVCAELYRSFCEENKWIAGVRMTDENDAKFFITSDFNDVSLFQNSKYVYSDTSNTYSGIFEILKRGEEALFIGLPCQVAGLYRFLKTKKQNLDKLLCVDLVCHGVTPSAFWHEYIDNIQTHCSSKITSVSFRTPVMGTDNFVLSVSDSDQNIMYKKTVKSNDPYQVGYHYGISYRENCYDCKYARKERVGDLTLADFFGVGLVENFEFEKKNVSCVLVNTNKGLEVLQRLKEKGMLEIFERPIEEEYQFEKQLNEPTARTKYRDAFIAEYKKTSDFTNSMNKVIKPIVWKNRLKQVIRYNEFRTIIGRCLSRESKRKIKSLLKRNS